MAGAGSRSKKDGSPSAKVGSIEVLRPRQIGPTIPSMEGLRAMYQEAAGAKGGAKRTLEERAESARRARAALATARGAEKRAALAKAAEGTVRRPGETDTQYHERLVFQHGHLYADRMHTADAAKRAEMTAQINAHRRVMPGAERAMRAEGEAAAKFAEATRPTVAPAPAKSVPAPKVAPQEPEWKRLQREEREANDKIIRGWREERQAAEREKTRQIADHNAKMGNTIKIHTGNGPTEIPTVHRAGDFALHGEHAGAGKVLKSKFVVTHTPTGMRMPKELTGEVRSEAAGRKLTETLARPEVTGALRTFMAKPTAEHKAAVEAAWEAAKAAPASKAAKAPKAEPALTIPEREGFHDKLAPKIPHRAYAIATHRGEDGTVIQVHQNRTKTAFWVTTSRGDFSAGKTLHTTSKAKGEAWRAAVERGEVSWPGKGVAAPAPAPKVASRPPRPAPITKIEKRRNDYIKRDVYDVTHVPSGKSIPFLNSFGEKAKAERVAKGTATGKTINRLISGTPDQQRRAYEAMRRYSTTIHGIYDSERRAYHNARRDRIIKAAEKERADKAEARREKRMARQARAA